MTRWGLALALCLSAPVWGGEADSLARAIRENSFDPQECYRVRDLTLTIEDIKIYLTDGHLIFSRPVGGKRIAAVFVADVEGGDAEVILLPPDRAERRSLAAYIHSPNLDEHFRTGVFVFTGGTYESILAQFPSNPANRRTPDAGAVLDEQFTPVLRSLSASYQTRLVLDLLNHTADSESVFAAVLDSPKLGAFDLVFDPLRTEPIIAGQMISRENRLFLDAWTSFKTRSMRNQAAPRAPDMLLSDYRIEATIGADLDLKVTTRVKVRPSRSGVRAVPFDISPLMTVTSAKVDGCPAEVLQRESPRGNAMRAGNEMFVVAPATPLTAGRDYEFVFEHSGKVVFDTGDRVLFVSARENWYPTHGLQFATYDLTFRHPKDLDLVAPGDLVETHPDGDSRVTHFRVRSPIRFAGFNLGNYARARAERGGYVVEVCANRVLERSLKPPPSLPMAEVAANQGLRRTSPIVGTPFPMMAPNPLDRLQEIATGVASALDFMASKFGPPALDHLTVSPIPGTFGQGFPGLIYLSTLSYLQTVPRAAGTLAQAQELFFQQVLQAHETAHQWWGNRVTTGSYRDAWMMEALANYSALLYLEKTRGAHAVDLVLDTYRTELLAKGENGQPVDSAGPITMGTRLESSLDPGAWRTVTYGKGTWIIHMLRRYLGDQRFFAMLNEVLKRYDHLEISTEDFRRVAAHFTPPKSDDADLETFFDTWIYGTGIPSLKMSYSVKGKAPALRLVGTVTQTDVGSDFSALVPVEIHFAGGHTVTQWVRCGNEPATFSLALRQPPLRVTLDPDRSVLRR
ncbi:MAG: M1 family metallopeptidase [Bryobacteraceae bacterium]